MRVVLAGSHWEREKDVRKLHMQWGHPRPKAMRKVLRAAGCSKEGLALVDKIHDSCPTCQFLHSRRFRRPTSAIPKYTRYLQCLRLDLLYIEKGVYFLHAIDAFSRYNLGKIIRFRTGAEVCRALMRSVFTHPSPPQKLIIDGGGEFVNEEVLALCEAQGIQVGTSAAEAHWMQGQIERAHVTVSELVRAVKAEIPLIE